jgi:methyl-accepting chemotaxis protein
MFRFKDLSFKAKLATLVGVAATGLLLFGAVALSTLSTVEINSDLYKHITLANDVVADYVPPPQSMLEINGLFLSMADDPANARQYIDRVHQLRKDFEEGHAEYMRTMPEGALKENMKGTAFSAAEQLLDLGESGYIPLILRGDVEQARAFRHAKMVPLYIQHAAAVDEVVKLANEAVKQSEQNAASVISSRTAMMVVIGLVILAVTLIAGALVAKAILTPLGKTMTVLASLAAGDLTQRLEITSEDEMGQMARSLNQAIKAMHDAVSAIEHNSESVASAAEEISAAATQSTEASRAQSDQSTQVATAMQEMSASVNEVSNNSSKAAGSAREAAELAILGGKTVKDALASMRSIAESVAITAKKIEELGKNSEQIGKIVRVIDEIADQTNLLALNAAIEAARAGEQGRGFAVVADEVRKLAERTTKATKEIAQMIENVQKETGTAVEQMQAGTKQVDVGVATTAKAGASLEEIIAAAQRVGDMISQIATSSIEQSSTAEQINSNIEQIARISRESATGVQQSASACHDLSNLALDLQQLVGRFKISQSPVSPQPRVGQRPNPKEHTALAPYDHSYQELVN